MLCTLQESSAQALRKGMRALNLELNERTGASSRPLHLTGHILSLHLGASHELSGQNWSNWPNGLEIFISLSNLTLTLLIVSPYMTGGVLPSAIKLLPKHFNDQPTNCLLHDQRYCSHSVCSLAPAMLLVCPPAGHRPAQTADPGELQPFHLLPDHN